MISLGVKLRAKSRELTCGSCEVDVIVGEYGLYGGGGEK